MDGTGRTVVCLNGVRVQLGDLSLCFLFLATGHYSWVNGEWGYWNIDDIQSCIIVKLIRNNKSLFISYISRSLKCLIRTSNSRQLKCGALCAIPHNRSVLKTTP